MSDRSPSARPAVRGITVVVDVALFTSRGSELAVLLLPVNDPRRRPRERWSLPAVVLRRDESPNAAAIRASGTALEVDPALVEQAGARSATNPGAEPADVAITYFGLVPVADGAMHQGAMWAPVAELPQLDQRQRDGVSVALTAMRSRVDDSPIAFRLLPPAFTLSELQTVYELLLGRRLHKASFRRSLHASALVEATDEWRSEGRGRPAQLFKYAPRRRKRPRRGVRFDLLA
jgi:8-oxo-dGTP diphosphatase